MLNGICTSDYPSPSIKEPKPTLIWNSCAKFTPGVINSFIEEISEEEYVRV
jgi:hypothetical protein